MKQKNYSAVRPSLVQTTGFYLLAVALACIFDWVTVKTGLVSAKGIRYDEAHWITAAAVVLIFDIAPSLVFSLMNIPRKVMVALGTILVFVLFGCTLYQYMMLTDATSAASAVDWTGAAVSGGEGGKAIAQRILKIVPMITSTVVIVLSIKRKDYVFDKDSEQHKLRYADASRRLQHQMKFGTRQMVESIRKNRENAFIREGKKAKNIANKVMRDARTAVVRESHCPHAAEVMQKAFAIPKIPTLQIGYSQLHDPKPNEIGEKHDTVPLSLALDTSVAETPVKNHAESEAEPNEDIRKPAGNMGKEQHADKQSESTEPAPAAEPELKEDYGSLDPLYEHDEPVAV